MKDILQELGYLRSESLVYSALLGSGPLTAWIIAKKSNLNRVSVYKALDKLIKDGLVSYTIKANRKSFKVASPEKIREIIAERKEMLNDFETAIPALMNRYIENKEEIQTDTYEGIKGLKTILEELLRRTRNGDEWLVLGGPKKAELLGGFFKDLNKRRAQRKVKLKIIYNKEAKLLIEERIKQPLTEVRLMPGNLITPASIEILNNDMAIILYFPKIIAFHVRNKEVADSFKNYFHLIWKISDELA